MDKTLEAKLSAFIEEFGKRTVEDMEVQMNLYNLVQDAFNIGNNTGSDRVAKELSRSKNGG